MNQECFETCRRSRNLGYYHAGVTERLVNTFMSDNIYQKICAEVSGCNPHLKYERREKFYFGPTSEVYHGIKLSTGRDVAIKVMPINPKLGFPLTSRMYREIRHMKAYPHPNIVRYLDSYILKDSLWIVMEYVDGITLADLVKYFAPGTHSLAVIVQEVLKALKHLHNKGVMHRDIRPDNILLGKNGQVKLIDFGSSTKVTELHSLIGTRWFMAPELIESDVQVYDHKIDIWALGVTLIEMMDVVYPDLSEDSDIHAAIKLIVESIEPQIVDNNVPVADTVVKDFLRHCLQVDPNLRPTASELLDHDLMEFALENSEEKLANLVVAAINTKEMENDKETVSSLAVPDEREMESKCCDKCSVM